MVVDALRVFREKSRVNLCATRIMGTDVIQISAVGQCVLGDDVHVAPVKIGVPTIFRVDEAFAKNKVGWAKAAWIRSSKKDGVAFHLWVDIKWRCEHVVPVPVAKEMAALFVIRPIVKCGANWQQGKDAQQDAQQRSALA